MKKNLLPKLTTAIICSALFFTSCKNESEIISLREIPTATEFKALRWSALADITQTKTFKVEEGVNFTSTKGAIVTIQPNCITTKDGTPVLGDVKLSFVEIYDRGNMVLTNKPVMGKNNNGDLLPLVTGGQYNINITQGNNELKSGCYFNVRIPTNLTGGSDNDMSLWTGTINDEGNLVWDENDGEKENGLGMDDSGKNYSIWGNEFGWTNVDRFYNDPRPKTQIKVTVPEGYNSTNAGVYLSYEGERNLLAQLDTYNKTEKFFTEHYGFVPIGLNVHVIFITENKGSVSYAIKKVKIAANATINIADSELKTATKEQVVSLINALN